MSWCIMLKSQDELIYTIKGIAYLIYQRNVTSFTTSSHAILKKLEQSFSKWFLFMHLKTFRYTQDATIFDSKQTP